MTGSLGKSLLNAVTSKLLSMVLLFQAASPDFPSPQDIYEMPTALSRVVPFPDLLGFCFSRMNDQLASPAFAELCSPTGWIEIWPLVAFREY